MRILHVWLTCVAVCGMITMGWYLCNMIVLTLVNETALSVVTGEQLGVVTLVEYVTAWWGPVLDVFTVLWAIVSSQARDVESEVYR